MRQKLVVTELIDMNSIEQIRAELHKRQQTLIALANNPRIPMDNEDRDSILRLFKDGKEAPRPQNIPELMKLFFLACFSYAPLRKFLTSENGGLLPTRQTLPKVLSIVYGDKEFLFDETWIPEKMHGLATAIQNREHFDLTSNQFRPRMIAVLLSGSEKMASELKYGLSHFYEKLDTAIKLGVEKMWDFANDLQKDIFQAGIQSVFAFLLQISDQFVKIDHHFKKEFPELIGIEDCGKLRPREHFILSQHLSRLLQMSPQHLDLLLYQWGRYKKYKSMV